MNALLPIIEELEDAKNDGERAYWLLCCPLAVLFKYHDTIINRLRNRHFVVGVDYVEFELAACRQVRLDGLMELDNPLRLTLMGIAYPKPFDPHSNVTMPDGTGASLGF